MARLCALSIASRPPGGAFASFRMQWRLPAFRTPQEDPALGLFIPLGFAETGFEVHFEGGPGVSSARRRARSPRSRASDTPV